ncbi:MAG TPA: FecR domain-containing protein [Polyangiaceae bacterium]
MNKPIRSEAIERVRESEPAWDDLRERRLMQATWARFRADADYGEKRAEPPRARRPATRALVLAIAALAFTAGAVLFFRSRMPVSGRELGGRTALTAPSVERRMTLEEGTVAVLTGEAHLDVALRRPDRTEVVQRAGKVDYSVRHDPERKFVVRVGDVTVTVLGTQFSVELTDSAAEVRVVSGHVRVDDGRRTTELVTGEALRVQAWQPQAPAPLTEAILGVEPATAEDMPVPAGSKRAQTAPAPSNASPASPEDLLAAADRARAAGDWGEAVQVLRAFVQRYPGAPQRGNVLFMLARAERARGSHAEAARDFGKCAALGGTLAGEALSEEAASWLSAGQRGRAVLAARRYVKEFPSGPHAEKMRAMGE